MDASGDYVCVVGVDVCSPNGATGCDFLARSRLEVDGGNFDGECAVQVLVETREWGGR